MGSVRSFPGLENKGCKVSELRWLAHCRVSSGRVRIFMSKMSPKQPKVNSEYNQIFQFQFFNCSFVSCSGLRHIWLLPEECCVLAQHSFDTDAGAYRMQKLWLVGRWICFGFLWATPLVYIVRTLFIVTFFIYAHNGRNGRFTSCGLLHMAFG